MSPEVDKIRSKHRNPVPQHNKTDGPHIQLAIKLTSNWNFKKWLFSS